jgi:hypothetical protein
VCKIKSHPPRNFSIHHHVTRCSAHQNRGYIEKDALAASRNPGVHWNTAESPTGSALQGSKWTNIISLLGNI